MLSVVHSTGILLFYRPELKKIEFGIYGTKIRASKADRNKSPHSKEWWVSCSFTGKTSPLHVRTKVR